jgi:hypothetical protein
MLLDDINSDPVKIRNQNFTSKNAILKEISEIGSARDYPSAKNSPKAGINLN